MPRAELLAGVAGTSGLLCLLSDRIDREVLDAAGACGTPAIPPAIPRDPGTGTAAPIVSYRARPEGHQHFVRGLRPPRPGRDQEAVTLPVSSPALSPAASGTSCSNPAPALTPPMFHSLSHALHPLHSSP